MCNSFKWAKQHVFNHEYSLQSYPAVQCEFLLPPINGRIVQTGTVLGSTATFSCLPGFRLVGEAERRCQENGEWSGQPAFCMRKLN